MAYLAPIHQPSSVTQAIRLNFLSPEEECLAVAKSNRLDFYVQSQDGLALKYSRSIYGRITMLNKIRPASSSTDHLFVGTDRYVYFTLSWDANGKRMSTEKEYVDQADKFGRESQTGDRCLIDPTGSFMTLELYEGTITVLPIAKKVRKAGDPQIDELGDPLVSRISELFVRSSTFYQRRLREKNEKPKIGLLYENMQKRIKLTTRQISYAAGLAGGESGSVDLEDVPGLNEDLEQESSHLIPVSEPFCGLLILSETSITYYENSTETHIRRPLSEATIFKAWEQIDNQRFLLADEYGKLYVLMLEVSPPDTVTGWRMETIGETSTASVLRYLGNGRVFVGSQTGDSQVIEIRPGAIEILQTIPSVAPVVDFTVMDMGNRSGDGPINEFSSGQARIVTGSGAFKDGSLRSVRSGVGLEDLGVLDKMENVTNMFSLKSNPPSVFVDTLLVSFIDETRLFRFSADGDVEELESFNGLQLQEGTLFAGNVSGDRILQITRSSARLSEVDSGMASADWQSSDGKPITAATSSDEIAILSIGGSRLVALDLRTNELKVMADRSFDDQTQISCVTLATSSAGSSFGIVGFWESSAIAVISLSSLETISTETVGESSISVPRSVLVAQIFDNHTPTIFIGLADGLVVTYSLDMQKGSLFNKKSIVLGAQPAEFRALPRENGLSNVFATCEHPSLIYGSEGRLTFSAITAEKASCICPFNAECYPGAIAIATPNELKVSLVDEERSTHVQSLHVGETVRRIVYSPSLKAFGLGTIKRTLEDGEEIVQSNFKLADEILFGIHATYDLNQDELVECVMRCELDDGTGQLAERFVIGTSYVDDEVGDSIRGRILILEVTEDRALKVVTEHETKGSCRCLAMCEGNIVAGLVKTVIIYSFSYEGPSRPFLAKRASYRTSTAPIDITTTGSLIAIADLMKSLSIVKYTRSSAPTRPDTLTEVARHYSTTWATAVALIDDNTFVEADAEGNLLVLRQDVKGVTEEDRRRLTVTAELCLGEMVNKIRRVDVPIGPDAAVIPRAFVATTAGSIHLLALIHPKKQDLLMRLQTALAEHIKSPGNVPFATYRAYRSAVREAEEPWRFVDGELVERFLDLGEEVQAGIVEDLPGEMGLEEVRGLVEGLRRLR